VTKAALATLFVGVILFLTGKMQTLSVIVLIAGGLLLLGAIVRYRGKGTEPSALPEDQLEHTQNSGTQV
jgi:hypothetical protein